MDIHYFQTGDNMLYKYKNVIINAKNLAEASKKAGVTQDEFRKNAKEVKFKLKDEDFGYEDRIQGWEKSRESGVDKNRGVKDLVEQLKENGCCICGYERCSRALVFHHVEPSNKTFEIRVGRVRIRGLQEEVGKCLLLCLNCHAFVHEVFENEDMNKKDMQVFLDEHK